MHRTIACGPSGVSLVSLPTLPGSTPWDVVGASLQFLISANGSNNTETNPKHNSCNPAYLLGCRPTYYYLRVF